ncbi:hypothetical protein JTE90_009066 [Oedothorax gibbosus]|uniref:Uncharacterized protein n=1 Tax=Oedothorax gibbosus TaxID=931172 RepID=A0AAV6V1F0_9ARAC|nr:hypothetical protein JTE90_009066 [Oedothorax gibbosus]
MLGLWIVVLVAIVTCGKAYTVYGNGATSERNLPLCSGPRESCNVIRRRFWLSPLVHRLCKCPDLTDCRTEWSQDKRTIAFNARAQLKFCSQVGDLESCQGSRTVAAEIRPNGTISINCFCGQGHYFRKLYNDEAGQYFECLPLGSCTNGDFCGQITANSYETYHVCTCPSRHICVLQNRELEYVNEFLYQGQAYRGTCQNSENTN